MLIFNVNVAFDPARPGAFLNDYTYLIGDLSLNRKTVLTTTTKRLLQAYQDAESSFLKIRDCHGCGLLAWIEKQKKLSAIKKRIARCKEALVNWITKSVSFFRAINGFNESSNIYRGYTL